MTDAPTDKDEAYFIKLGEKGEWESECLRDGTLRFGYHATPHNLCLDDDWAAIRQIWMEKRGNRGVATRDVSQIRTFYEAPSDTLFITFSGGFLYWCKIGTSIELLPDASRIRRTVDGWHNTSVGGTLLTTDRLSGNLLKVQMFRGTICKVGPFDYLLRKLNDELSPEIVVAEEAESKLRSAIVGLMRLLTWQDFESLVDLVFSTSGWRRISRVGGTQKTVDIELMLPTTSQRAFVQIKSEARSSSLQDYSERFESTEAFDCMFFVWHSGNIDASEVSKRITLVGPAELARMVLDAGLLSWLREKVS
ncbi:MAG: restriction endonuclease [Methylovirgula sp.]|uniref:restriction endonuclease n=1 Tax=Methylovirgula sp. TaxID=1978224 RepID=UPI0030765478